MKFLLYLLLCVCVWQKSYVDSGIIEKIKSGASVVKQTVHCGAHKVKNIFVEHEHTMDPCDNSAKRDDNAPSQGEMDQSSTYDIDIRGQEFTTTPNTGIRERRLISVESNCPAGYLSDKDGNCLETF